MTHYCGGTGTVPTCAAQRPTVYSFATGAYFIVFKQAFPIDRPNGRYHKQFPK